MGEREPVSGPRRVVEGPRAARIAEVTAEGIVMVRVGQDAPPLRAWVAASISLARLVAAAREGAPVLVDFLDGDPTQPVLIALLVDRVAPEAPPRAVALEAAESITLACGASVVELHAAGHVEVRGREMRLEAEGNVTVRGVRIHLN
ncbi:hypothetical protein [Polyangium sp. y55x31]|uniref:hypothetical protein n=1 Tax=Polyangium sp. y55x31 TaxID=3042688 RepID=UPI00248242EC|nr:hypothetical protein [Polyangium sp. y55x31]MDI1483581.1 hypothetical protein [Polyangium sp. y55x31]